MSFIKPRIWANGSVERVFTRLTPGLLGNARHAVPAAALQPAYKLSPTLDYRLAIMKRAASTKSKTTSQAKKPKPEPVYHLTPPLRDESGEIIWPAPKSQIERARRFILDCVAAKKKTLIVPDKDADGLTSGVILMRTLILLGLPEDLISVHLMQKGSRIHDELERKAMAAHDPSFILVLDQGSQRSPPVIDSTDCRVLIIDHHWAPEDDNYPLGAEYVTACLSPPVATSSLLTYHLCSTLHDKVPEACAWLCAVGTHGDLSNTFLWEPPFPDMQPTFRAYTKTAITKAVSQLNGPRRTAGYNVRTAWDALVAASSPKDIVANQALQDARNEVNSEVARCKRAAPKFSADGRVAVLRINSSAQVHPVIATRWAGHLQSSRLEVVLVANEGYLPGTVNFSCRVARCAKDPNREMPVNIIEILQGYADKAPSPTLRARLGNSFARGHQQASGGVVPKEEFEELMDVLEIGRKKHESRDGSEQVEQVKTKTKSSEESTQSNTLTSYFKTETVRDTRP